MAIVDEWFIQTIKNKKWNKKARFRGSGLMFVDKGYQEHEESNKEFNTSQKFPIYGNVLSQLYGQKERLSSGAVLLRLMSFIAV